MKLNLNEGIKNVAKAEQFVMLETNIKHSWRVDKSDL